MKTKYRVTEEYQVGNNPPDAPRVLWEGENIKHLEEKYPRSEDRRIDDLAPQFSCSDFVKTISFQTWNESTSKWEDCEDPRQIQPSRRRRRW